MFWVFLILFLAVIAAKYYTAVGTRNLERRLNRVKADLEAARQRQRESRQRVEQIRTEVELTELQVRFMKELIHDIQVRLTQSVETASVNPDLQDEIASAVMRF